MSNKPRKTMKNKLLKTIYMLSQYFLYGFVLQLLDLNFGLPIHAKGQYKSIDKVVISISANEMTVGEFYKEVQRQTPFTFSYDSKKIDRKAKLAFDDKKGAVEEFLVKASRQSALSFRQINHSIDVKHEDKPEVVIVEVDPITVSGKVSDINGMPLPGVTVFIPGTTTGTATDLDGLYTLHITEGASLVFSFIGFET